MGNYWTIWATFYSNIWSHYSCKVPKVSLLKIDVSIEKNSSDEKELLLLFTFFARELTLLSHLVNERYLHFFPFFLSIFLHSRLLYLFHSFFYSSSLFHVLFFILFIFIFLSLFFSQSYFYPFSYNPLFHLQHFSNSSHHQSLISILSRRPLLFFYIRVSVLNASLCSTLSLLCPRLDLKKRFLRVILSPFMYEKGLYSTI